MLLAPFLKKLNKQTKFGGKSGHLNTEGWEGK